MDPISVAASIVGLLGFCVEISNYLVDVKNTTTSVERLRTQVWSLQQILEQLNTFLREGNAKTNKFATSSSLVKSAEVCECHLLRVLKKLDNADKTLFH
jgi:hypothetical protein